METEILPCNCTKTKYVILVHHLQIHITCVLFFIRESAELLTRKSLKSNVNPEKNKTLSLKTRVSVLVLAGSMHGAACSAHLPFETVGGLRISFNTSPVLGLNYLRGSIICGAQLFRGSIISGLNCFGAQLFAGLNYFWGSTISEPIKCGACTVC